jgi:nucleoside-diphosphate-sugar epimerase
LDADAERINGRAFNVCRSNASVMVLARMIRDEVDPDLEVHVEPTDDLRSYHLSNGLARESLGFMPERELVTAVHELRARYAEPQDPEPGDSWYRNVRWMTEHPELWRA